MRFRSATLFLIVTCSVYNGQGEVTTDGCDVTKKCFQDPTGCAVTDSGCRFISWRKGADEGYEFEMSGGEGGGSQYIAFALGLVNRMETADLYYCDGTQVRSGAIQVYHRPPKYLAMEDGLETKSASTVNGVGQCVLKRPTSVAKNISITEVHDFDIANEQFYHLLVAVGDMSVEGEIRMHNWRNLTDSKIDFSEELQQSEITSDGCGATKNCFKDPANCDINESGCRFYSWSKGDGGLYNFEMSGGTGSGQQYIAMALGILNQMKDADLYYCDGRAVRSGVIRELHNPPAYYEMTGGLATKSASTVNGVAKCVFSRPASVVKTISGGVQKDFDITKQEFHLLGAIGPMNGSHVQRHNVWIKATENTFNFANEIEQSQITSDGCGSTKTCLRFPDNCQVGTTSCRFYSWQKMTEETFNFEMVGSSGNGDQYVAFALGTQSAMTDADVYYCDGLTIRSGVITELHNRPTFLDMTGGLQTVSATTIDGVAHCVLKRPASVTKKISGGISKNFNLNEESYFLLASAGNMDGAEIQQHIWAGKTDSRVVSSASKVGALQPIFVWFVALLAARSSKSLAC